MIRHIGTDRKRKATVYTKNDIIMRGILYSYTRLRLMRNNYLEYLANAKVPGIAILAIEFGPFGNHIHILVINCR